MNPNDPGSVIKPGGETDDAPQQAPASNEVASQNEQQTPEFTQPLPVSPTIEQIEDSVATQEFSGQEIEWTASEFVANQKNSGWFGLLALASLVLAAVVFILTRDAISTGVIVVLGIIVGLFANHQPRSLRYLVNRNGITIGEKLYPYSSFKSFSISHDQAMGFISLLPLKRFMPPISIHYAPDDEDKITEVLALYLPYEEHKTDLVDKFTHKIRF